MKPFFSLLFVLTCLNINGQPKSADKQTGWLVYWGGAAIWYSDHINSKVKEQCFFTNKIIYKNGLKVNHIPEALYYQSIAKGYKISDICLNGSQTIDAKLINDDSIWVLPVKGWCGVNTTPLSGLSPNDTLAFNKDAKRVTIIFSFEADYEVNSLELLRSKDKRRLKKVKVYEVYPPH